MLLGALEAYEDPLEWANTYFSALASLFSVDRKGSSLPLSYFIEVGASIGLSIPDRFANPRFRIEDLIDLTH